MYLFLSILLFVTPSYVEQLLKKGEISKVEKECRGIEGESFFEGEVKFFEKDFDAALSLYGKLASSSPYANDALLRTLIIKEINGESLQFYADAELAIIRDDPDGGVEYVREGITRDSSTYSYAASLLSMAYERKDDIVMAIQVLLDAVQLEPASPFSPYLLERAGILYERMGKYDDAKDVYSKLCVEFPDSPIVPVVRNRVKKLQ